MDVARVATRRRGLGRRSVGRDRRRRRCLARESGALSALPIALHYRASVHIHAGELGSASSLIEEADTITDAMDAPWYEWKDGEP